MKQINSAIQIGGLNLKRLFIVLGVVILIMGTFAISISARPIEDYPPPPPSPPKAHFLTNYVPFDVHKTITSEFQSSSIDGFTGILKANHHKKAYFLPQSCTMSLYSNHWLTNLHREYGNIVGNHYVSIDMTMDYCIFTYPLYISNGISFGWGQVQMKLELIHYVSTSLIHSELNEVNRITLIDVQHNYDPSVYYINPSFVHVGQNWLDHSYKLSENNYFSLGIFASEEFTVHIFEIKATLQVLGLGDSTGSITVDVDAIKMSIAVI